MRAIVCAFVCLCVPFCAFGQEGGIPGYMPGATSNVGPGPMTMPPPAYHQPMYMPMPQQSQTVVVQSANDSAMLEAVKQGKGFNLRVDLIDPNQQAYQYQQYQQNPIQVTPYQCPQQTYCQPRQYYDTYGRPIYWDGYRWRYYQQQNSWYPGCNLGF